MANIKFSAFTQKVVTGDVDFLVGYTGGDNVRISPAIFSDIYLPRAGGIMTGTLNLNDNVKAIWGSGSDLQIYHDTSHSFISEQGTGSLITLATDYQLNNAANTQNMMTATDGGAVTLFTAGAGKLATTATGVSVTGNIELTEDVKMAGGKQILWQSGNAAIKEGSVSSYSLSFNTWTGAALTSKMFITSAGNVGIGTTAPASLLEISKSVDAGIGGELRLSNPHNSDNVNQIWFGHRSSGYAVSKIQSVSVGADNTQLKFITEGASVISTKMTITEDGDVGIGTSVPASILHLASAASTVFRVEETTNNATAAMYATASDLWMGSITNHPLKILTNDVPAITIDTSQNIAITGAYTDQNGVRTFKLGGTMANGTAYDTDITVDDDNGTGTVHHITAMMTHFSTTYGCVLDCYAYTRGTGVDVQTDLLNQSNAAAGGWTVSKPNATTLRITKTAGTYSGLGNYQIIVVTFTP